MAFEVETSYTNIIKWSEDFVLRIYRTPLLQDWYYCVNGGIYRHADIGHMEKHRKMTTNIKKRILTDLSMYRSINLSLSDWEIFHTSFQELNWKKNISYGVHLFIVQEEKSTICVHDEKMFGPVLFEQDQEMMERVLNDDYWVLMKPFFFSQFTSELIKIT